MLALPPPYGLDSRDGAWISLTTDQEIDPIALMAALWRFSCYPPVIQRVVSCLHHSGRYDCILQASWFRNSHKEAVARFAEVGVTLTLHTYLIDLEDEWRIP